MNFIHSTLDALRDRYAPVSHTSTFRSTGQITPEEFVLAGDFLVYKFPSWSWSDASHPSKRASYLPPDKQFLVTRGVPCHRRLDENFTGNVGEDETIVASGDGDDWLSTGGGRQASGDTQRAPLSEGSGQDNRDRAKEVKTLDGSGNLGKDDDIEDEDEIPDMDDEEDDEEAIIRDPQSGGTKARMCRPNAYTVKALWPKTQAHSKDPRPLRTYNLYITYTPYYRTPRLYLSAFLPSSSQPIPPIQMMEDIVGDYKDKTVTLEEFPFFDPTQSVKMASVHPCKHASVMRVLLDRADQALRTRRGRAKTGSASNKPESGMEGLVDATQQMSLNQQAHTAGVSAAGGSNGDEWEVLDSGGAASGNEGDDDSAIRIDQFSSKGRHPAHHFWLLLRKKHTSSQMEGKSATSAVAAAAAAAAQGSTTHQEVQLHPLVLLSISDLVTRHATRNQTGMMCGAILGRPGRNATMEFAFECKVDQDEDDAPMISHQWFTDQLQHYKEVHKDLDFVGWFALSGSEGIEPYHIVIHQQILRDFNDSALLALLDTAAIADGTAKGGQLPVKIYESAEEIGQPDGDITMRSTDENEMKSLRFMELPSNVETNDAEMIGVDFVARGGAKLPGASEAGTFELQGRSRKGKGKAHEKKPKEQLTPEEEELIASLTQKANATTMMRDRIRMIKAYLDSLPPSYLNDPSIEQMEEHPQVSHTVLRSISSLLSRLELSSPSTPVFSDIAAEADNIMTDEDQEIQLQSTQFAQEKEAQKTDVQLLSLLGLLGDTFHASEDLSKKSNVLETARMHPQKAQERGIRFGGGRGNHELEAGDLLQAGG
ncbi:MAG: E2-like enzyme [Alyxoria varia]|nr:MAG: E2-like enzyme [Alyxoria varia]